MNTGVTATTLIEFIAAMPCDGERRASAFITNDENAKKTPAFRPHPKAEAKVTTTAHRSITVTLPHLPVRETDWWRSRLRSPRSCSRILKSPAVACQAHAEFRR